MYIIHETIVSVSQYMHDPRERHMQLVDKILQYLKSNLGKVCFLEKNLTLKIYTDPNYVGFVIDKKSIPS